MLEMKHKNNDNSMFVVWIQVTEKLFVSTLLQWPHPLQICVLNNHITARETIRYAPLNKQVFEPALRNVVTLA